MADIHTRFYNSQVEFDATANHYDVVIIGAGLAGLTLARQLTRSVPSLSVLMVDKQSGPLPTAAHKVGESTVEGGTHYLRTVLGLAEYLDAHHLPKLGLRFFGGSKRDFAERFEIGALDFPPVPSMQIDRGLFETELRKQCRDDGVTLLENVTVREIEIGPGGAHHRVVGETASDPWQATARWLVDASGRRRLLQHKLGLAKRASHRASACWWRLRGERDMSNMRPDDPKWHARTRHRRWFSTNHIVGHGYWVWIIPLSSNNTSIGIVADERLHPIRERASYDASLEWLERHEPHLAAFLGRDEPLDFLALKEFAYTTSQAFSSDRWACVGESAAFPDPLYSVGTDLIAWGNTFVSNLIEDDWAGRFSSATVELYDDVFRRFVDALFDLYADAYPVLGNDLVTVYKLTWDALHYFSFPARALLHDALISPSRLREYWSVYTKMAELNHSVQAMFADWAARPAEPLPPGLYHPFVRCPDIRVGVLGAKELDRQPFDAFLREQTVRFDLFERLATALYRCALDRGLEPRSDLEPLRLARESTPSVVTLIDQLGQLLVPVDTSDLPSAQAIREVPRTG